jgi:DNA-binding protein HU-beta
MNKAQLVDKMSEKAGLTKTDTKKVLDAFVAATTEALKAGDKIQLVGFGTFSVSLRKEKKRT